MTMNPLKILFCGMIATMMTSCVYISTTYSEAEPGFDELASLAKTNGQLSDIVGVWSDVSITSRIQARDLSINSDVEIGKVEIMSIEPDGKVTQRFSVLNRTTKSDGFVQRDNDSVLNHSQMASYLGSGVWQIGGYNLRRAGDKLLISDPEGKVKRIFVNSQDQAALREDRMRAKGAIVSVRDDSFKS